VSKPCFRIKCVNFAETLAEETGESDWISLIYFVDGQETMIIVSSDGVSNILVKKFALSDLTRMVFLSVSYITLTVAVNPIQISSARLESLVMGDCPCQ